MTNENTNHENTDQSTNSGTNQGRTVHEEFRVSGEAVVAKVKELVREGNVRRITIKNDEGKVLIEIPLTIGVIGTVLLPVWAAISAIAALVANLTISVEKVDNAGKGGSANQGTSTGGDITPL